MWQFKEAEYRKWMAGAQARFETGVRPDLFERYCLPPDSSDVADIESALTALQGFWGKNKINPRFTALLTVLLSEHRMARDTLLDPEAREEARKDAEAEQRRRAQEGLAGVRRTLAVIGGKGYITPAERDDLIRLHKARGLSEAEVIDAIGSMPIHAAPPEEAGEKLLDEGLPKHVRDLIRVNLAVLACADLFDFLRLTRGSTAAQWAEAYDKKEKEWRTKAADGNKAAANVLLGMVKVHILSAPEKYEMARQWEFAETLRPDIELVAADKRISALEYDALLKQAVTLGMSANDGARAILELARQCGATVEIGTPGEHLTCPNCKNTIPRKGAPEQCPFCSRSLWLSCPKCSVRLSADTEVCGGCGLSISRLPEAERSLVRAKSLLSRGFADEAETTVNEVESLLDTSTDAIVEQRKAIQEWRVTIAALLAVAAGQHREHRLYGLVETCRRIQAMAPHLLLHSGENAAQLLAAVQESIRRVEDLIRTGVLHQNAGDLTKAASAFEDALALAQDSAEALKRLEECPPPAPIEVSAHLDGDGIVIAWFNRAGKSPVTFRVVRHEGLPPGQVSERTIAEATGETTFRDDKVPPGALLSYSVCACRARAKSSLVYSAEVVGAMPVANFVLEGGNRLVTGSWTSVPAGVQVRVIRKMAAVPSHSSDGDPVTAQSGGFSDTGLDNGRLYGYGVVAEYPRPGGGTVSSVLRTGSAQAQAPLTAIRDLTLQPSEHSVQLSWSAPDSGDVWIYRLSAPPTCPPSKVIELPLPTAWGIPLPRLSAARAVDASLPSGELYYLPVTISGTHAMPGIARRYSAVRDISGLEVDFEESGLHLTWSWPKDATHALISWNPTAYPSDPGERTAGSQKVMRQGDAGKGSLQLPNSAQGPHFFTAFAGYSLHGREVLSGGASGGCRTKIAVIANPYEVQYGFKQVKGLFARGRIMLHLKALNRETSLPEMVVVSRPGQTAPTTISDGVVVHRFGKGLGGPQLLPLGAECAVEFELKQFPSTVSLFFRDGKHRQSFRLKPINGSGTFCFS